MRPWKFLLPLLATSLCFAAQPDRIGTIDASSTYALPGSHHPKAQPEFDQGVVDASLPLTNITMVTVPSAAQKQALDLLVAQQQIPGSPRYHKWLTPAQFGSQFGLSQNDLNKITAWLKSEGFTIQSVSASRNTIMFSGTAGQVESAFGTEIHTYLVDGKKHIANASPVLLPSVLNGVVAGVMGLHNFLPHPANRFGKATLPRRNYYSSSLQGEFLAPGDIATNYDITPLYSANPSIDGTGQKLAIIGQTDVYLSDINNFRTGFSLNPITGCSTNGSGIVTSTSCATTYFNYVLPTGTIDTGVTYPCGDLGEADLDIEWSGAIAQNAQIIFVNSPTSYDGNCDPTNSQGVNSSLIYAIQQKVAPVISMSYGICELEGDTTGLDPILEQGASQGITILNSSDDISSAGCDFTPPGVNPVPPYQGAVGGLAVSYPASSAYVTGVGGTEISLTDDGSPTYWGTSNGTSGGSLLAGVHIPEIPWNDDVEIGQYCEGQSNNSFCLNDEGQGGAGWINLNGSGGTPQNVQADIWISGGGGGASNCFTNNGTVCSAGVPRPTWQSVSVAGAPATGRYVPDVSLMASPNFPGYIFCTQLSELGDSGSGSSCGSGGPTGITTDLGLVSPGIIGGTSVSSPVFAGIVTLLNQYLNGSSLAGLGLINPMLYTLAATPSNAFHPVTSGDDDVYCQSGQPLNQPLALRCPTTGTLVIGYSATNSDSSTGYNLVNGLGSVDVNNLAVAWNAALAPQFSLSAVPASLSLVAGATSSPIALTVTPVGDLPGMTVNLSCTGLPSGSSCTFNPTSVNGGASSDHNVSVTVFVPANVAPGSFTITVTGAASGTSTQKQTTSVSLTLTATNETFTVAPSNGDGSTYNVTAGQAASVQLVVSGTNGFITSTNTTAVQLNYACTGLPSEATCNFSPSANTDNAKPSLSISTTAPTTELRTPFGRHGGIFYAMLLPGMFGIVFAAGSRGRGARLLGLIVVLAFSTLWLGACGGSSGSSQNNPGTPAGSYTVTVTAQSASGTGLVVLQNSKPCTFTLTVAN